METRAQIMNEARELFLATGLSGFSMRALASRVGVSATALYRHFADKDALLATLLGEAFQTFGSYLGRSLAGKTPFERIQLAGKAYVDFAIEHPRDYELMFLTNCAELGFDKIQQELNERARPTFEFLVARVDECLAAGVFDPRPTLSIAVYIWSSLHGVVSLWLFGQLGVVSDPQVFKEQAAFTLDRLLAGLTAHEPNAARRRARG
jgi:AcrR family transcriptional regulator